MARYEKKYLLSRSMSAAFVLSDLDIFLREYGFRRSNYEVESFYFDYSDLQLLYQKQAGEWVKNKFRIRHYPVSGDLFWEKKAKLNSISYKDRVPLRLKDLKTIEERVFTEWGLRKACCVRYDRTVWHAPVGDIKFNIDLNVRGANYINGWEFALQDIVAEFKYSSTADLSYTVVRALLDRHKLKEESFSKYFYGMTNGNT